MNPERRTGGILILVNGAEESAAGVRARRLVAPACDGETRILYRPRRLAALGRFLWAGLTRPRPSLIYVVDLAWSGAIAALLLRWVRGIRFVIDTGDAVQALSRSLGRSPLTCLAVGALETTTHRQAATVVVRGRYHALHLRGEGIANPVAVIPDAVDVTAGCGRCGPEGERLRQSLGLSEVLTVGLVGSCRWNPRLCIAYGWDVVELLAKIRDDRLRAVVVGDGDGIGHLRNRARQLGVGERLHLIGRVPELALGPYLHLMDVCLSTQTDDLVGWVRTTGKLPLYLVHGRFVLASDVGTASWVLPEEMRVPYSGEVDPSYPDRLAERVRPLLEDRRPLPLASCGPDLAARHFGMEPLRARLRETLTELM